MTKDNTTCSEAATQMLVLEGKLEDVREVKTNLNWKLSSYETRQSRETEKYLWLE